MMAHQESLDSVMEKLLRGQASRDGELERLRCNEFLPKCIAVWCQAAGIPEREYPTVLAIVLAHEHEKLYRRVMRLSAMASTTLIISPPSASQP